MKRIALIIFPLLLLLLLFHQPIFDQLAAWLVRGYAYQAWGASLHYDRAEFHKGRIRISNPHFDRPFSFQAEEIQIGCRFEGKKRVLHFDIDLYRPKWDLRKPPKSKSEKWVKALSGSGKWIKIHPRYRVSQGTLTWREPHSGLQHEMDVELQADSCAGGVLKLYSRKVACPKTNHHFPVQMAGTLPSGFVDVRSPVSSDRKIPRFDLIRPLAAPDLEIQAASFSDGMELRCRLSDANCRALFSLAAFLDIPLPAWEIDSGILQGDISAKFAEQQRPNLEGELFLKNASVQFIEIPLRMDIQLAKISFEQKQTAEGHDRHLPLHIGKLEMIQPAVLSYESDQTSWLLSQIRGDIRLDGNERAFFQLEAQAEKHPLPSSWNLKGAVSFNALDSNKIDLLLDCLVNDVPNGSVHFSLLQLDGENKRANMRLEKLSYAEFDSLQRLFSTFYQDIRSFEMKQGIIDAVLEADIESGSIGEVRLKKLNVSCLKSRIPDCSLDCSFDNVWGNGRAHFGSADFLSSVHAGLHLENGEVILDGIGRRFPLKDIQAHLLIHHGQIEDSLINLEFAGLKGKMDVAWGEQKRILSFKLDGTIKDLADFFPKSLEEGLKQHFLDHHLLVLADVNNHDDYIGLKGTINLQNPLSQHNEAIHYGCKIVKSGVSRSFQLEPVGWFYTGKLPVEKYLSPFLFCEEVVHLEGDAKFKGLFDEKKFTIEYEAEHLKIENENFSIEMGEFQQLDAGPLKGVHQIDLKTMEHLGKMPIENITYVDKRSGLRFEDIHGFVAFEQKRIEIQSMDALCEGIAFSGRAELDYSEPNPGMYSLCLDFPVFSGRVSNLQKMLKKLDPAWLKIPFDGEVQGKGKGVVVHFDFDPDSYTLKGDVEGYLTEGSIALDQLDMNIRGLYLDFSYHHQDKMLDFKDIQGTLLVGKAMKTEEYLLSGGHLRFRRLPHLEVDADLSVHDCGEEICRLAVRTKTQDDGLQSILIDPTKSHFSTIHPKSWTCRLKDWSKIEKLDFSAEFPLEGFFYDLSRFKKTGLFPLSHCVIERLASLLPISGDATLIVRHQPDQTFAFVLEGDQIAQGPSSGHHALLKGAKKDKKWVVEEIQWDDWNAYGEFWQEEERWKIPFWGMNIGQTALLGLEGEFIPHKGLLHACLNYCELDLAALDRWDWVKPFIVKWDPKGVLKGSGVFQLSCLDEGWSDRCYAMFQIQGMDLSLGNRSIKLLRPFFLDLKGDGHGINIRDAEIDMSDASGRLFFHLHHIQCLPDLAALNSIKLSFNVPAEELSSIDRALHELLPNAANQRLRGLIQRCHCHGGWEGELEIDHTSETDPRMHLTLRDGIYRFDDWFYDLNQFQLSRLGGEIHFSTAMQIEKCPFQIFGKTDWPNFTFWEARFVEPGEADPMAVNWETIPNEFPAIKSIKGNFSGCSFDLVEDPSSSQNIRWKGLKGSVLINFNRLASLCSPSAGERIQELKINTPVSLTGKCWLDPSLGHTLLDTLYFKGQIESKEAIIKGCQVDLVEADVQYVPGRMDIQNLMIQDRAGTLEIPSIIGYLGRGNQGWNFIMPSLKVRNLKVSQLRDAEGAIASARSKFRSLVVKKFDLCEFQGELDSQETWNAKGTLQFANRARKNIFSPLFAIPAEIILRLGLDPSVLNPVTGTIAFNLQGDRFYLTKLKDVYSEGRGSKFHLAEGPNPSWVDFQGNLSVNIRMKQYNLIFKLAELFTVSVEGNIRKPTHTLKKVSRANQGRKE
jgi:hypothetical protein